MLVKTIDTALELREEMASVGRDYYSDEAYEEMINYYTVCEGDIEFDPVAISLEWIEESLNYVVEQYTYLDNFEGVDVTDIDAVLDALQYYTYAYKTSEDTILYLEF